LGSRGIFEHAIGFVACSGLLLAILILRRRLSRWLAKLVARNWRTAPRWRRKLFGFLAAPSHPHSNAHRFHNTRRRSRPVRWLFVVAAVVLLVVTDNCPVGLGTFLGAAGVAMIAFAGIVIGLSAVTAWATPATFRCLPRFSSGSCCSAGCRGRTIMRCARCRHRTPRLRRGRR
jgi:hypothetical protein